MVKFLKMAPGLAILRLVELGLQHEQQHQELIVTDIKHLFSMNPLFPACGGSLAYPDVASGALEWLECAAPHC